MPSISVIIPALNEEEQIATQIARVISLQNKATLAEVIVVDGGSRDATIQKAEHAGAKVIESPQKGRARQMNLGAEVAQGDLLYFLHADSYPPKNWNQEIIDANQNGYGAGCFRLRFAPSHPLLAFYAWFTRFDLDAFRYGDQSLFVEKKIFDKIGGFRNHLVVMEDNEIVRRLKQHTSFYISRNAVTTSSRKYHQIGYFKLQLVFTAIYMQYQWGAEQDKLVAFYRKWIG